MNTLIEYVCDRVTRQQKNCIIVVNGPAGSGKSYGALRLAEMLAVRLGTNFSIEGNVDFKFSNLLQKMMHPDNARPGMIYVFEECGAVGAGSSSREWQSKSNMFFSSFLQTNRCKQQVVILTFPSFWFLDSHARCMVHLQLHTAGINRANKRSKFKVYCLQVSARESKIYFKLLRWKDEKGQMEKMKYLQLQLPSDDLLVKYEKMKMDYVNGLNNMIIAKEAEKILKEMGNGKELTPKQEKVLALLEQGLNVKQIAMDFGVSKEDIYHTISSMKRKGYVLKQIRNENNEILRFSVEKPGFVAHGSALVMP